LFYQVVTPLLGVGRTTLIGISTPQDEHNYFSQLMAIKDQFGQHLFLSIQIGLVCKACQKSGQACNHWLDLKPHWQPRGRMGKVDAIMAGNPEMRDRELRGVIKSSKRFFLTEEQVEAMRAKPMHSFTEHGRTPDVLFTAIDPSGGGAGSDYAIVTMAKLGDRFLVRKIY
jgi:hypothetical protein